MDSLSLALPDAARTTRTSPTSSWLSVLQSLCTAGIRLPLLLCLALLCQSGAVFAQTVPAAPTLTAVPGNAKVSLSWTAVSGATSYDVFRSTTSGTYGASVKTATSTSWVNPDLINGTTYYFVVRAKNAAGSSGNSNQVASAPVAPPATPTGLTAVGGTSKITLNWTAVPGAVNYDIRYSTTSGGPYTLNAGLDIVGTSYTHNNRDNDTIYYYVITASNQGGTSAPSAQVRGKPIAAPVITATASDQAAMIDWEPVPDAVNYDIKVATTSGGPYTLVHTNGSSTYYTHTGLTNGTNYYYVVTASYSNGTSTSANSNQKMVIPVGTPGGVAVTATTGQATIVWNSSVAATQYRLYRSPSAGFSESSPLVATITSTGAASYTYTDTGLTNGGRNYYMVRGANSTGESTDSAMGYAWPMGIPNGFTAIAGNGRVDLNWLSPPGKELYGIKRSTVPGGPYTTLSTTVSLNTYADLAVTNGTTYYYRVYTINSTGSGSDTAEKSALPASPPATPTNLTVVAGNGTVTLSWTAVTTGPSAAASYVIASSTTPGGPYTNIDTSTSTSKTVTATNGALTYYVVRAKNAGGESGNSNEVAAVASATLVAPSPVSAEAGNTQVTLRWPITGQAISYTVKRSTSPSGPFANVATGLTGTSYVNTALTNGTNYYYVITATNSANAESANSVVLRAMPGAALAAPSGLVAVPGSAQVALSWNHAPLAVKYQVKRSTSATGPFTNIGSQLTENSFGEYNLTNGTTYYYVVSSFSTSGAESANSAVVAVTPMAPPLPPNYVSTVSRTGSVSISWGTTSNTDSYEVKRGTSQSGPFTTVTGAGNLPVNQTQFTDTTVTNGMTYYYVVHSRNVIGQGLPSNPRRAIPLGIPTNLVVSQASPDALGLKLTFDGVQGGVRGYRIYRATAASGPFEWSWFAPLNPTATGLVYVDENPFEGGTTYYYRVQPDSDLSPHSDLSPQYESSDYSYAEASGSTLTSAPTTLNAQPRTGEVALDWSDVSGANITYELKRGTSSGGPFTTVTGAGNLLISGFTDTTVTNGTTYYYVVIAKTPSVSSLPSAPVEATPLAAPASVTVTQNASDTNHLRLTITAVPGASHYHVQRSTSATGPFFSLTSWADPIYIDSTVPADNTTYYYRVYPVKAGQQSAYAYASGSGTSGPAGPASPTSASVAIVGEDLVLTWASSPSSGITKYDITATTQNTSLGWLGTVNVPPALTSYSFVYPNFQADTTYTFTITPFTNVKGRARTASITTPPLPPNTNAFNTGDLFIGLASNSGEPTGIEWYGGISKSTNQKSYFKTLTRPGNMSTYGMVFDMNGYLLAGQGAANKISYYSPLGVYSHDVTANNAVSPASTSYRHQFDGSTSDFGEYIYYANGTNIVNLATGVATSDPIYATSWLAFSDGHFYTYYSSGQLNPPSASVKITTIGGGLAEVSVPQANAVAAGPNNTFYVAAGTEIRRYAANGTYIGMFDMPSIDNWYSLAMGPEGSNKFYAAAQFGTTVYEFSLNGGGFSGTAILNTQNQRQITGLAVKDSATFPVASDQYYFVDGGAAYDVQVGQQANLAIVAQVDGAGNNGSLSVTGPAGGSYYLSHNLRANYSFTPTAPGLYPVTASVGNATRTYLINAYAAGTHSVNLLANGQKTLEGAGSTTLTALDTSNGVTNSPAAITSPAIAAAIAAAKASPTPTPIPGEKSASKAALVESSEEASGEAAADATVPSGESRSTAASGALSAAQSAAGTFVPNDIVAPFLQLDITHAFDSYGPLKVNGGATADLPALRTFAGSEHPLPYMVMGSATPGLSLSNGIASKHGHVEYFKVTNLVGRVSYASVAFQPIPSQQYDTPTVKFIQSSFLDSIVVAETAVGSGLLGFEGRSYRPLISIRRNSDGKYWSGSSVTGWKTQEFFFQTVPVAGTLPTARTYNCTLRASDLPQSTDRTGGPFYVKAYGVSHTQPQDQTTETKIVNQ
jgi:fibronectin type 3 domain-containing protein